ncbi:hypothetical protein D5H78_05905 [Vallicoccus soli]|uniref:LemA family protein n=1 Tax=Vallicoccus soli TaxID=2339232 RepID=A0A3A3Z1Y4_9ACTN|nr:hypothetical protein D5H78_05905 [Vallicoccus soli]
MLLVVALVALAVWYLTFTAARLDRLHARAEGARAALDAQLQRRSSATAQLASSGLLDPASSVLLLQAGHDAREAGAEEQEVRESDLSRALRAVLDDPEVIAALRADPVGADLLAEVADACRRVGLARRFHNDAVLSVRVVRAQRLVRWLHLAGTAPLPASFEIDDAEPALV